MTAPSPRLPGALVLAALVSLVAAFPPAVSAQDASDVIDGIFEPLDRDDAPGCAVAVTFGGEIIYEAGFGLACVEQQTPITPDTIFRIGSVSKQFTAACVGLLAVRGEVDLEAPISTWFDELTEFDPPVLLSDLIHHTSGLPDYVGLHVADGDELSDHITPAQTLGRLVEVEQTVFAPGSQFHYSNTNYFLLSQLVERVSGKTLRQFAQDELFEPLGMERSHYQDAWDEVVLGRANGHEPRDGGRFAKANTRWEHVGDGGVFTTVRDLAKWEAFWLDPSRLADGEALTELMLSKGRFRDGREHTYAFGLGVLPFEGRNVVTHSGGWVGFVANMIRFPDEQVAIFVLANSNAVPVQDLSHQLARTLLGAAPAPAQGAGSDVAPDAAPAAGGL
jgi:CubicO group peptidase (beta-lactamase class C family)